MDDEEGKGAQEECVKSMWKKYEKWKCLDVKEEHDYVLNSISSKRV